MQSSKAVEPCGRMNTGFDVKDGSYKWIFDRGYIMRDKSGMPYRLIGAMQDVTDQRRLQQQLLVEQLRHKNEMARV
jgi:two-component system sensor histidine kinase UhpB